MFVVDDHEIVRRGVRDLLEAEPDIEVVGEASTASSALAQIPALRPSVAVLDVRLPDGDGVAVCREVRSRVPEVACLMFSAFSKDEALLDSIMAGAAGYVLKQVRGSDLVGAVRTVASGQSLLDSRAASKAMARLRDEANGHDRLAGLSARERKVLELIGEGLTNRQIGERLFVSEKTVKNYVSALFVKLDLKQRTQAAAYAVRVFEGYKFALALLRIARDDAYGEWRPGHWARRGHVHAGSGAWSGPFVRSQLAMRSAIAFTQLTRPAPSAIGVPWRPPLAMVVITHLVARLPVGAAQQDREQ